jgi:hypothetical protein
MADIDVRNYTDVLRELGVTAPAVTDVKPWTRYLTTTSPTHRIPAVVMADAGQSTVDLPNCVRARRVCPFSTDGGEQVATGLLTSPAGFGADPAVLVHLGV